MFRVVCALAAVLVAATAAVAQAEGQGLEGLRMNQMQVIGTHNSYHVAPSGMLYSMVKQVHPDAVAWDYTHLPLDQQLDNGVRSFELDLYHQPDGARVMHIPRFDNGTTCETFVGCLATLREWSEKHPDHVPLIVLVELKQEPIPQSHYDVLPFDAAALDQLDKEIRDALPPEKLLTPDDVRGDAATLPDAIRTQGWPLLDDARGKTMLVLHSRKLHGELYTADRPSLEGRAMFLDSVEGAPHAAVFVRDNPDNASIPELVKQGYIVRTRADADLVDGVVLDTARRDAALASGAQIVSTDYPYGEAHNKTGYVVALPDNAPARRNPVL